MTAADNAVAVQGSKAVVKRHLKDGSATLTATITKGTSSATKTYKVTVPGLLNEYPDRDSGEIGQHNLTENTEWWLRDFRTSRIHP